MNGQVQGGGERVVEFFIFLGVGRAGGGWWWGRDRTKPFCIRAVSVVDVYA